MKKSTLLSLATAGAVIATSAGTFALWDTIESTSEGTVTMANAIVLEAQTGSYNVMPRTPGTAPVIKGSFAFKVTDKDNTADTLTLAPKVVLTADKDNADAKDYSSYFDVTITQTGDDNGLSGLVDSKITKDDTQNSYEITLTENNTITESDKTEIAGKNLTVLVTGTLSQATTPAA